MANDAIDQTPPDEGAAQQAADLSSLEFTAESEDYQPGPETLEGDHEAAAPEISTAELCTSLLSIGFNLIGSRRGNHWNLTAEEATETGNAIGAVLDKYFPDLSEQGVEITAVMTCAMVLTPRLMQDKANAAEAEHRERIERQRQAESAAAEEGAGHGDPSQSAA